MASAAARDGESATERRNPAFRRSPHSRQYPPTHSLPIRSSSSPPKPPHQQDVRIRSPHGQEHEGYGRRPGGGGRAPNFRRGGRWREKAPQNRMTEENAIGESLSPIKGSVQPNGHRGVVEHNRLPKGKNVEIGNVTMQGKKPDTSPVVETFVGRWGEESSATKESHGAEEGYANVPSLVSMTKSAFAANSNNRGRQRGWWGRAGRMVENRSKAHGSISMESAIPVASSFTSTPPQQTHDGVSKTWRSKPGNPGITSKQHAQEPGMLLSRALNDDGDDDKVAVLQKAERVRHDVQIDLKEDGILPPNFTNLNVRKTDMKLKNVEGGCWDDHSWGDREALANGPSGWDDFVETTTQMKSSQKWEAKGSAYNAGLNISDFDCCDTEVGILGTKVLVTVAATAATIEKWLQEHQGEKRFGFDIEWKPTKQKGDYSDAATLQLSTEKHCLLVQLLFIDHFPECLKNLLADSTVVLGGVGIKADAKKLKFDHNLICEGVVELGELAAQAFQDKVLQTAGLITLTDKVLGATHKKNRRATMSNWEIRDLTFQQIQYAAADAWLSYHILMALCTLKENPPLPFPNSSEPARIHVGAAQGTVPSVQILKSVNPKP